MLEGEQALSKVGKRREDRGILALRQPGRTRAARPDDRLGHLLAALCAANLNRV
jgi:hypothetical protein